MIAYASRTGTRRNLIQLRKAAWRLLLTPTCLRTEGFRYALDNGAWSAYSQGHPWNAARFRMALRQRGADADWTVLPDIVAGGHASLDLSLRWMRDVLNECPYALLAVQDGMRVEDVRPWLGARIGVFVGGSTAWKLRTLPQWGALARASMCWLHVGRVNSARRIRHCLLAGATSIDGTSASRYATTLPLLNHARHQLPLFHLTEDHYACETDLD